MCVWVVRFHCEGELLVPLVSDGRGRGDKRGAGGRLVGDVAVMEETLDAGHVVLGLDGHPHRPLQHRHRLHHVHERQPRHGGIDCTFASNRVEQDEEHPDAEDGEGCKEVQPECQPPRCDPVEEKEGTVGVQPLLQQRKERAFHFERPNDLNAVEGLLEERHNGASRDAFKPPQLTARLAEEHLYAVEHEYERNDGEHEPRTREGAQ
mmetsp:Transcript_21621/g.61511  ORF Transcript_21621/g.61511 Transcript_21621/m.61511 type:complete len:207 (+) Transcript_21621:1449-2069(+)